MSDYVGASKWIMLITQTNGRGSVQHYYYWWPRAVYARYQTTSCNCRSSYLVASENYVPATELHAREATTGTRRRCRASASLFGKDSVLMRCLLWRDLIWKKEKKDLDYFGTKGLRTRRVLRPLTYWIFIGGMIGFAVVNIVAGRIEFILRSLRGWVRKIHPRNLYPGSFHPLPLALEETLSFSALLIRIHVLTAPEKIWSTGWSESLISERRTISCWLGFGTKA